MGLTTKSINVSLYCRILIRGEGYETHLQTRATFTWAVNSNAVPLGPHSACLSICSPSEPSELNSHICNFEDLSGASPIMGEHLRRYLPLLRGQEDLVMVFNFLPLELPTSQMFLCLHKVLSQKQSVLSSIEMNLLLRDDAYVQCELYGSHLVQVIFVFIFIGIAGPFAVISSTLVTHPYSNNIILG